MKKSNLRLSAIVFVFVILCFISCSTNTKPINNSSSNAIQSVVNINGAVESITEEELTDMLAYLASDELKGRLSGSPEEEMAAEYIAKEFESYGLKAYDNNGYFQEFSFTSGLIPTDNVYFNIKSNEEEIKLTYDEDYTVTGYSGNGLYQGKTAFVGYGVTNSEYNDYKNIDVKGKMVIIFRYSAKGKADDSHDTYLVTKIKNAINNGAKGIMFLNGPKQFEKDTPVPLIYNQHSENIPIIHLKWKGFEKLFGSDIDLTELQNKIDNNYKPNSFILKDDITINIELETVDAECANVIGYFEGNDPLLKEEIIILGGHYDHLGLGDVGSRTPNRYGEVYNGADDNASGIVGMMEVAEAVGMIKDKIKRTFVFIAFSGEEYGLHGSKYYVIEEPLFPLEDTVFMCNLDMIGWLKEEPLYALATTSDDIYDYLIDVADQYSIEIEIHTNNSGGSDHYYFANEGIPTTFLHTGLHDLYHTPDDDLEYINFDGLTTISKLIFELLMKVDAKNQPPS